MKVLVTGATGFVGTQIVRSLSESGHTVRIFARNELSPKVRSLVPEFSTELACGDILDPPSLKNAMVGVEAVIHLVGIISEVGKNTFENVHAIGTRNVVEAANAAGMKCVAVRFVGHHPAEALRAAGADRIVESLADIAAADVRQLLR